jgi:hypothetical protein
MSIKPSPFFLVFFISIYQAWTHAEVLDEQFPKFAIDDCILNKDPQSSWYRQEAEVFDVTESKKYGATIYVLYFSEAIRRSGQDKYGFFHIPSVDRMATLVKKGGCS